MVDLLSGLTSHAQYTLQSVDDAGNTPLLIGARWGHLPLVRKLATVRHNRYVAGAPQRNVDSRAHR